MVCPFLSLTESVCFFNKWVFLIFCVCLMLFQSFSFFFKIFLLHFLSSLFLVGSSYTYAKHCPPGHRGSAHFVSVFSLLFRLACFCGSTFRFTFSAVSDLSLKACPRVCSFHASYFSVLESGSFLRFSVPPLASPICAVLVITLSFNSLVR